MAAYFEGIITMRLQCLLSLTSLVLLGGCVCKNPAAWFTVDVDPNSAFCTGTGTDGDMGPPGQGPYVDWAMPRVPIGAPTIELHGGRFDPVGLVVELHSGSTIVPMQIASNDGATLIARPSWPAMASVAGTATFTVKNDQGTATPKTTVLVQPGFGPAKSSQVTLNISMPGWLAGGLVTGNSKFFVLEPTLGGLQYIDYYPLTGVFGGSNGTVDPGYYLQAAAADLDGDNTTDFAVIDSSRNLKACRYSAGYSCPLGDAAVFNLQVASGVAALGTGSTTSNRALIAVASQDSKLYRCFYLKSPATAQLCVQVTGFADMAKALLVQALAPSGRADMIVLNQAGQLTVWRSDMTDTFTKCSDCIDQTVAGYNFVAMSVADMDAKNGPDVVAIHAQGVVVLLNDGQGKLKAINTTSAPMSATQAITLGDIDNDGKPDLISTEAMTGKVWVWLNQSDGSTGDGKLAGPASALDVSSSKAFTLGANSLLALDGTLPTDRKQRIITTDLIAKKLVSWQNATQP